MVLHKADSSALPSNCSGRMMIRASRVQVNQHSSKVFWKKKKNSKIHKSQERLNLVILITSLLGTGCVLVIIYNSK